MASFLAIYFLHGKRQQNHPRRDNEFFVFLVLQKQFDTGSGLG